MDDMLNLIVLMHVILAENEESISNALKAMETYCEK